MKKLFATLILLLSLNTAHAVSGAEQRLLYMSMHSSIILMLCGYPDASWELVDVSKTLGHQAGYSDLQLAQVHKKIMAQVTSRLQIQRGMREVDCDNAVSFHTYAKSTGLVAHGQ